MSRSLDVALASSVHLPEPDPDQELLTEALDGAGIRSAVLGWDDSEADFAAVRMTVLRSTWDYPLRYADFRAWLERTAAVSELWNPLPVVRWNLHKRYLLELEAVGIPVASTELLERGSPRSLKEVRGTRGWDAMVVKPAVSANSLNTIRVDDDSMGSGESHVRSLVAVGDVLVQAYLPAVEDYGERAVIWIDGELTHAVRKSPRFVGSAEAVSKASQDIGDAEASLARRAITWVQRKLGQRLMYARVDMAPGPAGEPVVMELELIEPSLYFRQSARALSRFVAAIGHRVGA